jgi:hypothetical protein
VPLKLYRWRESGKVVCRARHAVPLLSEKTKDKAPAGGQRYKGNGRGKEPARRRYERLDQRSRPEASGAEATAVAALNLPGLVAG